MRLAPVHIALLFTLLAGTAWGAGERGPWGARLRTRIAKVLASAARRIDPPPPPVQEPEEHGRRIGYLRVPTTELVPRGVPGKPDQIRTTITETWREKVVTSRPAPLVAGTGSTLDLSLLDRGDEAKRKARGARLAVWRRVSILRNYLEASTRTVRAQVLPHVERILAAAPTATEYVESDTHPMMKAPGVNVWTDAKKETGAITIRMSVPQGYGTIADIEFNPKTGTLKVYDGEAKVTVTEAREGERALVQRITTTTRDVRRPTDAQRRFDDAFQPNGPEMP